MAREKVAEIGAEVVAAIEKIDQEAAEKKRRHLDTLKEAIKMARLEVKAAQDKVESLEGLFGILSGKPVQSSAAVGESSGGRMKKADKEAYVKRLGEILKGKMSRGDIASGLGIEPSQWGTIHKAAKAAGLKIGEEGERSARVYFLK